MNSLLSYHSLCSNLKRGVNFSLSRFGDGEWFCIFKSLGILKVNALYNTDKHNYFTDLGKNLARVVKSEPKYLFGLQRLAMSIMGDTINQFLKGLKLNITNGDILHTASIKGQLQLFFDSMENREVILVGNDSLLSFKKINARLISIPLYNCWQKYGRIKSLLKNNVKQNVVILYCASMMTEVLIDDLWNIYKDTITQIDCGSLFDPYVGRKTRTYHKNLEVK